MRINQIILNNSKSISKSINWGVQEWLISEN